jgi:hypothetical protein
LANSGFTGPDPFTYRAVWGVPVNSRDGFDLLVARQLLWMPYAAPDVRRMLFAEDGQPICPVCGELVAAGASAVVCVAVLADPALQAQIAVDPRILATRDPDRLEAWWLVHGDCRDAITRERLQELNQRIELSLRAATREN